MRLGALILTAVMLTVACGGAATTSASIAPTVAPTPTPTPEPTVSVADSSLGKILIAATNKMTLYTYAKDTADLSNCYDACATNWPPFTITASDTVKPGDGVTGTLASITSWVGRTPVGMGSPILTRTSRRNPSQEVPVIATGTIGTPARRAR